MADEEDPIERLREIYYDKSQGYWSANKLAYRARQLGLHIGIKKIREWLKTQSVVQVAQKVPEKPCRFNTIVAPYAGFNYQMDTMDMSRRQIHGYRYVLLIIDVHSRLLGGAAMKHKNEYDVKFDEIITTWFQRNGEAVWPKELSCDREYNIEGFVSEMEGRNIVLYYSQPDQPHKNAIVERVIRTLRGIMHRLFLAEDDPDWVAMLPDLITNYNTSLHSTIKATPQDVWDGVAENRQTIRWIPTQHKVGDRVRTVLRKERGNPFSKTDTRKVSKNVYVIVERAPGQGFKWMIANERTGDVVYGADGEPRLYLDYELINAKVTEDPTGATTGVINDERVQANLVQNKVNRAIDKDADNAIPHQQLPITINNEPVVTTLNLAARDQPASIKRRAPIQRFTPTVTAPRAKQTLAQLRGNRAYSSRRRRPVAPAPAPKPRQSLTSRRRRPVTSRQNLDYPSLDLLNKINPDNVLLTDQEIAEIWRTYNPNLFKRDREPLRAFTRALNAKIVQRRRDLRQ